MNDIVQLDLVDCPYCAEQIKKSAKKCRHCGEIIDAQMRDIEALKRGKDSPNVFMNAGGGGAAASASSSSAASSGSDNDGLIPFRHWLHIILSVVSSGLWIPVYIILYLNRNKKIYR